MNLAKLTGLVAEWHAEAGVFRRRGLESEAALVESFADELAARLREWELEELTVREAAAESGYSVSSIEQRIRHGDLVNAGEKGRPRIQRRNMPMKGTKPGEGGPDLVEMKALARTETNGGQR